MNEKTSSKLETILKNYNLACKDPDKSKAKFLENEFLQLFEMVGSTIICPAMFEIGNQLKSNGHNYVLGNSFEAKAIFMNILPNEVKDHSHPSIAFMAIEQERMIDVHTKSFMPGDSGKEKPLGRFKVQDITYDFVQHEILNLIEESFANH